MRSPFRIRKESCRGLATPSGVSVCGEPYSVAEELGGYVSRSLPFEVLEDAFAYFLPTLCGGKLRPRTLRVGLNFGPRLPAEDLSKHEREGGWRQRFVVAEVPHVTPPLVSHGVRKLALRKAGFKYP